MRPLPLCRDKILEKCDYPSVCSRFVRIGSHMSQKAHQSVVTRSHFAPKPLLTVKVVRIFNTVKRLKVTHESLTAYFH